MPYSQTMNSYPYDLKFSVTVLLLLTTTYHFLKTNPIKPSYLSRFSLKKTKAIIPNSNPQAGIVNAA